MALKNFSLFSNLLSFFWFDPCCFCYKSKSYLHSSILQKIFSQLADHLIPTPGFLRLQEVADGQQTKVLRGINRTLRFVYLMLFCAFLLNPLASSKVIVTLYICRTLSGRACKTIKGEQNRNLRSEDVFPVVASLPPKGREATTGNTSALRRLARPRIGVIQISFSNHLK